MDQHRPFPHTVEAAAGVRLRLAQDDDAETIAGWTQAPEVHRRWGGRAIDVDEVRAAYTGRRSPQVVSYVVCDRGGPVGYAQAWQRSDRCGIDMFIAAHAQGRGVGSAAGRALAEELTAAGWVPLTVDPALDNTRAIDAWRAAGFVETGDPAYDGGELVQVMTFVP